VSDVWSLLQRRRRDGAGAPLVTFVDAATGERTELSAVSFENAAAKIANALRDEYDLGPGATVGLRLPLHWQRSAWCAGAWTAGCLVAPGSAEADLVVSTVDEAATLASTVPRLVVVSLHPFGLPVADPLPSGVDDVTPAVRQQPDAYLFEPPDASTPALRAGDGVLDQSALLDLARSRGTAWGVTPGGRLLVRDSVPDLDGWLAAVAVPLACQASAVLVRGAGDIDSIVDQERVTARVP
jgi:uncharacterized protein (TIGR03089 family)